MEVVPSVTVLDLKIQLPFLKNHSRRIVDGIRNAEGNRAVMDAGVAAYLLNRSRIPMDMMTWRAITWI